MDFGIEPRGEGRRPAIAGSAVGAARRPYPSEMTSENQSRVIVTTHFLVRLGERLNSCKNKEGGFLSETRPLA
jgi:hypothetical protein